MRIASSEHEDISMITPSARASCLAWLHFRFEDTTSLTSWSYSVGSDRLIKNACERVLWVVVLSGSLSVVSDSLRPHGPHSAWDSPGQNTGVGSLSLLQGIFPAQRSNPGLLHCRWILYKLSHKGSPFVVLEKQKSKKYINVKIRFTK